MDLGFVAQPFEEMKTAVHVTISYKCNGQAVTSSVAADFVPSTLSSRSHEQQLQDFVSAIVAGINQRIDSTPTSKP